MATSMYLITLYIFSKFPLDYRNNAYQYVIDLQVQNIAIWTNHMWHLFLIWNFPTQKRSRRVKKKKIGK